MISNIRAERAIKRLPHVLSAHAPFLSTRMSVQVDFAETDSDLLMAFVKRAGPIADAAGYEIAVTFMPR